MLKINICEFAERMQNNGTTVIPFPEKRIIWSNIDLDSKDWVGDLKADYPDLSAEEHYAMMLERNNEFLSDERANLNVQCGDDILAVGDIGRWNGRRMGYKTIESGKISDCLSSECDYAEWYVDREGEFRGKEIHHDGTNYYLYRVYKDNVSDEQIENLKEKLYYGTATRRDITRITQRLGDDIAKVYGFDIPKQRVRNDAR